MKKAILKQYARLLAESGIAVRDGDVVIITAGLDQPDFVVLCAEACYRAGASKVIVEWNSLPLERVHARYRSLDTMSVVEGYERAKLRYRLERNPSMLYLLSDDPDGMKGMDQEKIGRAQRARFKIIKPYRDRMDTRYKWCIAATPGKAWAKKVFPNLSASAAVEELWKLILYISRVTDRDGTPLDPVAEWDQHNADLHRRTDYLNGLRIRSLEYSSANGTSLTVGLMPEGVFCGGSERTLGGEEYNPNIPSEEIFTTPKAGVVEGLAVASLPLSYQSEVIERFSVRFRNGRATEVRAERNEALLRQMIGMDRGAAMLGECALVPFSSPVRACGVTFYETLFDENAACHLALGRGFDECVRDYGSRTKRELRALGVNDSMIHVDFMIGTPDLSVTAVAGDGGRVPIFRNGTWAF